ncbi:MAG: DNA polymerase III subunit alpha [Bryobacteraceae bacterium]|nr:DNA polymerase III subunit alpha [Bryobacteraceae bacterium]
MTAQYAPLLNHSFYSLLDSTLSPQLIVEAAQAAGMTAAGIADRDTLAGAVLFYKAARSAGIHPAIGAELTLPDRSCLTLFAENTQGYANLCRLITETPSPENLQRYSYGLICLAGPRSALARALRNNQPAEPLVRQLLDLYNRNLALVLTPHNDDDLRIARLFAEIARRHRIPLAAGADTHYLAHEDHLRYEILASMRTLSLLNQRHPDKLPPGRYHFHTGDDIARYLGGLPQAIANTQRIAERCQFDFELGDTRFPRFTLGGKPVERPHELLRAKAAEGLRRRYGAAPKQEVLARLEREMSVIEEVGYAEYFLVFADLVEWCQSQGIDTLARGSAAGSLVCYLLGISNVCPFRFGLCFERFLNRERMQFQKLADIDLDLPWDRRDEVIQHVFDRYGREHVAMIGAVHTFQGRSAVADIAKVYGIGEREVRRFTENLPHFMGDAAEAARLTPECQNLPLNQEPYKTVLRIAGSFEGIPRHFAMHPCGLVISGDPIVDRMPLFESSKGLLTTHYAMDDVEELGLLKMDLLGQAGLTVLHDAAENIRANHGVSIDWKSLDWSDAQTWDTIATGNARGVFHIESPAMTNLLVMANCRDIDCLTAVESIIRPGAANEGRKRAFARRYQGLEPVSFPHPSLEPLLADTYGLLAYEEHILLVANGFAGMPWGRADQLRRALVKNRDHALIDKIGEEFRASALELGRTAEEIDGVWGTLREFAGYMFNKAHSAAYAVEAFAGAWIKTRYPAEFLAAVLSSRRGFYSPILYVMEALRCGVSFIPPCLHTSGITHFVPKANAIQLPVNQIKGLAQQTLDRIAEFRPFHDAGGFFRKVRPSRAEWLALLKSGALDVFGEPRGRLFWRLQRLETSSNSNHGAPRLVESDLPQGYDASPELAARWEHEVLGFPVSIHPLDYFAPNTRWDAYESAAELTRNQHHLYGKTVRVAGLVVADRHHPTPNGTMKFLTLADWTGYVEVSLFAPVYRDYGHMTVHPVLAIEATVDPYDNRRGFSLNGLRVLRPLTRPASNPVAAQNAQHIRKFLEVP